MFAIFASFDSTSYTAGWYVTGTVIIPTSTEGAARVGALLPDQHHNKQRDNTLAALFPSLHTDWITWQPACA
jgi:hypothetical protein